MKSEVIPLLPSTPWPEMAQGETEQSRELAPGRGVPSHIHLEGKPRAQSSGSSFVPETPAHWRAGDRWPSWWERSPVLILTQARDPVGPTPGVCPSLSLFPHHKMGSRALGLSRPPGRLQAIKIIATTSVVIVTAPAGLGSWANNGVHNPGRDVTPFKKPRQEGTPMFFFCLPFSVSVSLREAEKP